MTINSETNYTKLEGDGSNTSFDFTFYIADSSHLKVTLIDSDDTETVLTEGTDYSVSGVGEATGGTVTYPLGGSALAADNFLYMQRDIPYKQTADYSATSAPFPETIETQQDQAIMLMQQIKHDLDLALQLPISSDLTPEDVLNDILLNYGSMSGTGKGDMVVFDGSQWNILSAGSDGQYLKASGTASTGVEWDTVSGTVSASHSGLNNLDADDHEQYLMVTSGDTREGEMSDSYDPTGGADKLVATKGYVDGVAGESDHGDLAGLADDDHSQYSLVDGTRDYTAKVSYDDDKTFSDDKELVAKKYVDDKTWAHGTGTGSVTYNSASDDAHTIYMPVAGDERRTGGFTGVVSGVTPTSSAHLTTKSYVDGLASVVSETISVVGPVSTAASNRHIIFRADQEISLTTVYSVLHSDSPSSEEVQFDLKYGADLSGLTTIESITTTDMSTEGETTISATLSAGDYLLIDITSVSDSPENLAVTVYGSK